MLLTGFAGVGMTVVWLRHVAMLRGDASSVSQALAIALTGTGAGAIVGIEIDRVTSRPAHALLVVQGLLVAAILYGLWSDGIYVEVGVPALLMGMTFSLANAVGRRAGALLLAVTVGGVCGWLATTYVLLPFAGMQTSATALALAAGLALAPFYLMSSSSPSTRGGAMLTAVLSVIVAAVSIELWLQQPESDLLRSALPALAAQEKYLTVLEGLTEVVAVTEVPGHGRRLLSNARVIASAVQLPPLQAKAQKRVLVIGFGVGSTAHALTLIPSVEHIDVVDPSRLILEQARTFRETNGDVLRDPRVTVYINDARLHLRMQPESNYALIVGDPTPGH